MNAPPKLPVPTAERWQLLRAGIQNVWEYDDHRFVFEKGRLLLRGQNESGKTKALEVLLPFLLDASLQPQRLDPFGSMARSMRWNLIRDSNPDVGIAIGYVWLELGHVEDGAPRYWTIGAGLKARRAAPTVEDWYFATSRRVDVELSLLDGSRVPLTRGKLEEALGDAGQVFKHAADYRRTVNERLFGLPAEQYSALVDALLQLRRPQLSKQLDPAALSQILSASLPPLDAGVIGSLAEGYERLDRHRAEREEYRATLEGVRSFLDVYQGYVASFVKSRAQELTRAESAYHAARAHWRETQERKEQADRKVQELADTCERLDREAIELDERLRTLRASDEFRAIAALDEAEADARRAQLLAQRAKEAVDAGRKRCSRAQERLAQALKQWERDVQALDREKEAALAAARDSALEAQHGAVSAALQKGDSAVAQDALSAGLRLRREALEKLRALSGKVREVERELETALAAVALAEDRVHGAEERLRQAEAEERRARERFLEAVQQWAEGCRQLAVDAPALIELPLEQMRASLEPEIRNTRQSIEDDLRAATLALDTTRRELQAVREERDALAAARHHPPAPPPWRSPRDGEGPGAPLYMLCEFGDGAGQVERAGVEAALEAAGLLDARVMPEGTLLDAGTLDVVLRPAPLAGRTLASVLRPVADSPVAAETVERVLRSVALAGPGEAVEAPAWISPDGRFGLGPLNGRNAKAEVAFIGAAAREQARLRKLAELDTRIEGLEQTLAANSGTLLDARDRLKQLDEEVRHFPEPTAVVQAQARSNACGEELAQARAAHAETAARARKLEAKRAEAAASLDAAAREAGLRGWLDRLDDLRERTAEYERRARMLIEADARWSHSAAEAEERRREVAEEQADLERTRADLVQASEEDARARSRAAALRESVGRTRDELLAALRSGESRQEEVRAELERARHGEADAREELGSLKSAVEAAGEKVAGSEQGRRDSEARLREAVRQGLFALAGVALEGAPDEWSYTDALQAARKADEATEGVDPSDAARDKAWNKVSERHQDLMRSLRPEIRVIPQQLGGLTLYRASFNARSLALLELVAELKEEIASRDRLLGEEERKLFESFLTGEAHEHLRRQLRQATALVKRMNGQLQSHPTSSGMQMKLVWEVAEDAPPGAREAVGLLFKSGELLSDADRDALLGFLRQRMEAARARTEARTLEDQLLSVLDYRAWHQFEVWFRTSAEGWKRLTRKVHAAGSGGQKAVMLHLPLFAAAAAFYESARTGSPRLILLDEAFAGIDRETRGQLMGLLSEFDLDFVMTSFEEWGFYEQLDGLSTYHLAREKGMPGVFSEWFVWNGHESVQVQQ